MTIDITCISLENNHNHGIYIRLCQAHFNKIVKCVGATVSWHTYLVKPYSFHHTRQGEFNLVRVFFIQIRWLFKSFVKRFVSMWYLILLQIESSLECRRFLRLNRETRGLTENKLTGYQIWKTEFVFISAPKFHFLKCLIFGDDVDMSSVYGGFPHC